MNNIGKIHSNLVFGRRTEILALNFAKILPANAKILDVGCGDGLIDKIIMKLRPDITISGIDILVRGHTHIPVNQFNGITIPYEESSFDAVMFVDVLHHTLDPKAMLAEAKRVARSNIILKDHANDGFLSFQTLRFMDWFGNAHHGVVLPYNYWSKMEWESAFSELGLSTDIWGKKIGLYPRPMSWLFDHSLHFICKLNK